MHAQGDPAGEVAAGAAGSPGRSTAVEVPADLWPETVSPTAAWVPQRPVPPVVPAVPVQSGPVARPARRAPARRVIDLLVARGLPRPSWGAARWAPSRPAVVGVAVVLVVAVLVAALMVWRSQPSAQAAPQVDRRLPRGSASAAGVTTGSGALVLASGVASGTRTGIGTGTDASSGAASGAGARSGANAGSPVLVHVVGAVRRQGLVQLPTGARVVDAVRAAGGFSSTARQASVNLARVLVDGEQLLVQRRGGPLILGADGAAGPPGGGAGTGGSVGSSTASGAGATGGVGGAGTAGTPLVPLDLNAATVESLDALPGIGPVLAQRIVAWRAAHGRFSSVEELGEVSGIGESTLADLRPVVRV